MKKTILLLFSLTAIISITIAQSGQIMYAAAKNGLSVFADPNVKTKILGKISYGEKVAIESFAVESRFGDDKASENPTEKAIIDGADAAERWYEIKFKNKTAYVFSAQLLPLPPPKSGVKTLKNYFKQLSVVAGSSKVKQPGILVIGENTGEERIKELYKNGMEIHKHSLDEQTTELYILPEFTMQQTFTLLQLLQAYPQLVGEKDAFPLEDYTSADKLVKVTIDEPEGFIYITDISIMKNYRERKLYQGLRISLLDGQAVISFSKFVENPQ